MPSEATVNAAASTAETAAKGAATGAMWIFNKAWICVGAACGIFSRQVKKLSVRTVTVLLRVLNIANAALLGLACFYAFQMISGSVTRTFLATYIGLFATLLALFETRVKYTEDTIRRLFGFMFSYSGRTVFLVFLGAICFGMLDDAYKNDNAYQACLWVGLATLGNGLFNCFIICSHPGFQAANRDSVMSAAGVQGAAKGDPSQLTDAQVKAYLAAHPELAAQAAGGITAQAGQPSSAAGVPEWGVGASAAAAPGSAKSSGFGGFFGGGKKGGKEKLPADTEKGSGGGGGYGSSASSSAAGGAGYTPPQVPISPPAPAAVSPAAAAAPKFTGSVTGSPPAAGGGDHFAAGQSSFGYAAPSAGGAAAQQAAAMVAASPEEDNPFATDNPFERQ